jgi:hypothetical protein
MSPLTSEPRVFPWFSGAGLIRRRLSTDLWTVLLSDRTGASFGGTARSVYPVRAFRAAGWPRFMVETR